MAANANVARVVPSIPTFSVDKGFRYRIPEALEDRVSVGSVVRVPLSGRRVRGFVIEVLDDEIGGLRDIAQVSGHSPVFDERHLSFLRWAARHYVAPLSVVLERVAPPNNPPSPPDALPQELSRQDREPHVLDGVFDLEPGVVAWLAPRPPTDELISVARLLAARGQSSMVIMSTAAEVTRMADSLRDLVAAPLLTVHGDLGDREITEAWSESRHGPAVLVGTPRIAMWPVHRLGAAIVIQEGRRAMKDRQTPTFHVRDIVIERGKRESFHAIFLGPTPSLEVIARASHRVRAQGRLWPLVELVDRRLDTATGRMLTDNARRAIQSVVKRDGSVFVFAHRRGYAAAVRCVQCREVRRCPSCGSRPDPGSSCTRCGAALGPCQTCGSARFEALGSGTGRLVDEVRRFAGKEAVGPYPSGRAISVGTESDLAALPEHDLAVFTDVDGLLFGTNYRAAEECLRIGARLALVVTGRPGGRLLIQTSAPDHPVVRALRRGDPLPAIENELDIRRRYGYPPAGELAIVELRGDFDEGDVTTQLAELAAPAAVLGPAPTTDATRWLVQGSTLGRFREQVPTVVQRWRDAGAVVRIDADPIDL